MLLTLMSLVLVDILALYLVALVVTVTITADAACCCRYSCSASTTTSADGAPVILNETASSLAPTWLAAKRREGHHDPRVVLLEAQLEVLAALRQLQLHVLWRRHGEEEKLGPVGQRWYLFM